MNKQSSLRANNIFGTTERPRLCVYKGSKNLSAQIIDDTKGFTLVSASTKDKDNKAMKANIPGAEAIGKLIATKAKSKGIKKVAFDRRNYRYHGVVKALGDAARAGGLEF